MSKRTKKKDAVNIPRGVYALASIGKISKNAAFDLFHDLSNNIVFNDRIEDLIQLADSLRKSWNDEKSAEIISNYKEIFDKNIIHFVIS